MDGLILMAFLWMLKPFVDWLFHKSDTFPAVLCDSGDARA
jgi:hypothetical protein